MYRPTPNLSLRARFLISTAVVLVTFAASPCQTIAQSATEPLPAKLPELIGTQDSSFEIPFSIGKARDSVVEVALHVSHDLGKTWQQVATRPPSEKSFPFQGSGEGQYWFAIQTIGRDGTRVPPNTQLKPELRIAIDRKEPEIEFTVRPDAAGRVVSSIVASDVNIDPATLVIEYQPANDPGARWTGVPAQSTRVQNGGRYHDELAWWPEGNSSELVIRATISDVAGNLASATRQMSMPLVSGNPALRPNQPVTAKTPGVQTPSLANTDNDSRILTHYQQTRLPVALEHLYGVEPDSSPTPIRQASAPEVKSSENEGQSLPTDEKTATDNKVSSIPQPPLAPHRFAENTPPGEASDAEVAEVAASTHQWKSRTLNTENGAQQTAQATTQSWQSVKENSIVSMVQPELTPNPKPINQSPSVDAPLAIIAQLPASTVWPAQQSTTPDTLRDNPIAAPTTSNQRNAVWSSSTTGLRDELPPPPPSSVMSSGQRFDELQKLARHANSKHFQMEYDIDAVGPEGIKDVELWATSDGANSWQKLTTDQDLRSPVDVIVVNEGIFGFRIRVVSNDGLSSRQPRANDPADVWVNVDTTLPQAEITAAPYGNASDAGKLMIQWQASDTNLALRPIRLQFSPHPQGPWTTIEEGVRNESEYGWKPSVETPDQVYLRLEVRDEAGNIGVHMPNHPIDISGLIPRGHIRGITPIAPPTDASTNQGT